MVLCFYSKKKINAFTPTELYEYAAKEMVY